jgi:hypothetical protein
MNTNRNQSNDQRPDPARRTVIPTPRTSDIFPGWGVKF